MLTLIFEFCHVRVFFSFSSLLLPLMCSSECSYVNFEVLFTPEHPQVEIVNFCPKTLFVYVETENGTF